jgi:dTDP-4-amino-4,6-dideoxygalactose transaminase
LALSQLDRIDADSRIRIEHAKHYAERLRGIEQIICPPLREDMSHIYTYYPIQAENRDELLRWLMYHKRDVGAQHLKNCADLPSFAEFYRDCPNARATANQVVLLPTYPRYGLRQIEKTANCVCAFFEQSSTKAKN